MVHHVASARVQLRRHSGRRQPPTVVGRQTSGRSGLEIRMTRGRVGMWCLIAAESAMFSIFVVAYLYYVGKSLGGPTPNDVLRTPIFGSVCLFSSSITILLAKRAIDRGDLRGFRR